MLNTLKKLSEWFFFWCVGGGIGVPNDHWSSDNITGFDYEKTFFGSPSAFHQVHTLPGKHLVFFFLNSEGINYKILYFTRFQYKLNGITLNTDLFFVSKKKNSWKHLGKCSYQHCLSIFFCKWKTCEKKNSSFRPENNWRN